ncbi:MAG TPA: IPTL-CTERM sorting domain-containing protein [Thermoanaerobaculia bacterium]|nr:IPTL-CTERM sorting domain-containing protein [Thermoanaerobaculia bacterium]
MGVLRGASLRVVAFLCSILPALALASAAHAIQHEVQILLDLDDDATTGCTVVTVDGPFDGVEQILLTTVETTSPPPAGTVTDVALLDCVNPATDTFGPPASFDGGWPIGVDGGVDNGSGALDVVETYAPIASLALGNLGLVRMGVVVTDEFGGEEALLTVDDTPEGDPIVIDLGVAIEIPTLGEWSLLLLCLLLSGVAVRVLGTRGAVALLLVVLVGWAGVAWAAGSLDGLVDDWAPGDLLGSDGIVLFGKRAVDDLCLRVDVELLFNTPPVADPQSVTTDEDVPIAITLTGSDPESDPVTFSIVPGSGPSNGTLSGAPPNLTYTPDPDFNGPDSFEFQVEDPSGGTDTATVSITVDPVQDPPTANAQSVTTGEDVPVVITLTGSDLDGDSLTFAIGTGPVNGSLSAITPIDATSSQVTYTPNGNFNGADSFTFTANDGTVSSAAATVSITVNAVNDPPTANSQS